MTPEPGTFQTEAETSGISAPLSRDVNLLGDLLGEAIRRQGGDEIFQQVERLRLLCKRAADEDDTELRDRAARLVAGLDTHQLTWLLRAY
ncbi:MAG TPA: phosphoenolpyruvate carboxylase, partial [Longimicrobiales bacterium]|nr:phosphoenolpyruvate carboxylase [Longimicrobiales bacterium]